MRGAEILSAESSSYLHVDMKSPAPVLYPLPPKPEISQKMRRKMDRKILGYESELPDDSDLSFLLCAQNRIVHV